MSTPTPPQTPVPHRRPATRVLLVLALVALVVAGAVSSLASGSPDGLDAATLRGCTENADGTLTGSCIAQDARDHTLAGSPLADYSVGGDGALTGVAGVLGVLAVFAVAGGLFWLLARSRRKV